MHHAVVREVNEAVYGAQPHVHPGQGRLQRIREAGKQEQEAYGEKQHWHFEEVAEIVGGATS